MKRNLLRFVLLSVMGLFTLGVSATPDKDYLCFTANEAGSTVQLKKTGSPTEITLEYSTDGTTWSDYTIATDIALVNAGDKVYFRNTADEVTGFSTGTSTYYKFVLGGSIAASGNVMSLVDKTCQTTTIPCDYCFYNLFNGCTVLTTAPELPATTLAASCYYYMFNGCSTLTSAPALPATTLAESCYDSMFYKCSALKSAPALPATTLAESCYYRMFCNCKALMTAPELPATTLAESCYYGMFYMCSDLTSAPELPATTLEKKCYYTMFYGCSLIGDIKVAFSVWAVTSTDNFTTNWSTNVASTGAFSCPAGLTGTGAGKIPSGWTVKNTYDVTGSAIGWTSLCVNLPLTVPEGAEVYYASSVDGSTITLTQIPAGTTMAAKTAVIVKADASTTLQFDIAGAAGTSYENLFQGSSVAKARTEDVYVLAGANAENGNPQFQNYTGTTLGAHKIWLPKSAVGGATEAIQFRFDDATAISTVEMESSDDVLYNMAGQRVSSDYRGIVIKNGKKMFNL